MARRTSIAARLFVLVFGFSVAWFTLTSAVQMVFEYRGTRAEVDSSLGDLFQATEAGLENALWNYDVSLIQSSLEAIRAVKLISAAVILDDAGKSLVTWGALAPWALTTPGHQDSNVDDLTAPLYHRFPLHHVDGQGVIRTVGELIFVSDLDLIALRLANSFRLIVSNYLAITLGLMVILLFGLRRQVAQPLARITRAIENYGFDREVLPLLERPLDRSDELGILWNSFESLTLFLKDSYLQQRVMSAILEEAAVMALVCDADGLVVSSNAQARVRLTGSQPGGSLSRLTYGGDSVALFEEAAQLLGAGKAWRGELNAQGDSGQTFWLAAALLPLQLPAEPRARWGVMIEDVSAQRLTDLYRQQRDLAQQATRAKSLFLANLSHEIRTPMNAVVGLTALALGEEVSPKAREYLAELELSGAALLGIINDILDFSKLEEGKLKLESADFALSALLDAVGAMARFKAREKGLDFTVQVAPGVPTDLRGDPLRLQQILMNLVSNALKFTHRGRVAVRVAVAANGYLRFEVEDSGIGIAEENLHRLFHSFSQVDSSTTRQYGGTGLGLAISRQLGHLMGGEMGIQSTLGKGSLFWLEIPLRQGTAAPLPPQETWEELKGLRVLLAEDNLVNQLVATAVLKKVGIEPLVVADGLQAVEAVEAQDFDLVLMDLQMPHLDGLEATKILRQSRTPLDLPILAMTAHTFDQEREACLAAGMQDLIPKPVNPRALYQALSRWRPGATRT